MYSIKCHFSHHRKYYVHELALVSGALIHSNMMTREEVTISARHKTDSAPNCLYFIQYVQHSVATCKKQHSYNVCSSRGNTVAVH